MFCKTIMMGYLGRWLPVMLGGVAMVTVVQPVLAKTPAEIKAIAESSTVKIEFEKFIGTGVIIHRQGQVYSLVTNRHVVCGNVFCSQLPQNRQYRLSLPDRQQIQVNAKNIQFLGQDLDLAIIRFKNNRSYPLTKVAEPGKLKVEDTVFTAGFPVTSRQFTFGKGKAIAVVNRRIKGDQGGYSVIYNAFTLPGMSGGGVFNRNGDLVAIHGLGDRYTSGTEMIRNESNINKKTGYNRGIPVRWLVQSLNEAGIGMRGRISPPAIRSTADQGAEIANEYFILGFNKLVDPGTNIIAGKKEAIRQFSQAIRLNSNYSYAYFMRAYTYEQIGDSRKSLMDYNQAIALKPGYLGAYYSRGNLKHLTLNDPQGALIDYNQAISLQPDYAEVYVNRGVLKDEKFNDTPGALADYNQAIALQPDNAEAYGNRGNLKNKQLDDLPGALADYDQAIALNPDYASAYYNRGTLKYEKLDDAQGALADFNKAIWLSQNSTNALQPNEAVAYNNRGLLKHEKLNDFPGALADFNKAIALQPDFIMAHNNRGTLKYQTLNDLPGAVTDYNKAISLGQRSTNAIQLDLAGAYYNRGDFFYMTSRKAEALQDFRKTSELGRSSLPGLIATGVMALEQGQFTSAVTSFNQVLKIQPQLADALKYRGLAYRRQSQTAQAIQDWQQAAKLYATKNSVRDHRIIRKWLQELGIF